MKKFYFDANLFWGWIKNEEDLKKLETWYPNNSYLKAREHQERKGEFGFAFGRKFNGIELEMYLKQEENAT